MWANAQRDGRPAEYRWRPLFNAAVWLTPTTTVPCSNAAKTRNPFDTWLSCHQNNSLSIIHVFLFIGLSRGCIGFFETINWVSYRCIMRIDSSRRPR